MWDGWGWLVGGGMVYGIGLELGDSILAAGWVIQIHLKLETHLDGSGTSSHWIRFKSLDLRFPHQALHGTCSLRRSPRCALCGPGPLRPPQGPGRPAVCQERSQALRQQVRRSVFHGRNTRRADVTAQLHETS